MKSCPDCYRPILLHEKSCPFCGASCRTTSARSSMAVWISSLGFALGVSTAACTADPGDEPDPSSMSNGNGMSGPNDGESEDAGDSIDDDSWGEGATYAGPAWTDTDGDTWGDTDLGTSSTSAGSSSSSGGSDTDGDTDSDSDEEGSGSSSGSGGAGS